MITVSKAPECQGVRRVLRARQVRSVKTEVLDLVQPANVHFVQMPIRRQPLDRLVVRSQVKI